jgi:hypothetical protein
MSDFCASVIRSTVAIFVRKVYDVRTRSAGDSEAVARVASTPRCVLLGTSRWDRDSAVVPRERALTERESVSVFCDASPMTDVAIFVRKVYDVRTRSAGDSEAVALVASTPRCVLLGTSRWDRDNAVVPRERALTNIKLHKSHLRLFRLVS